MIPVVAADPQAPSALPTPDSYQWFTETGRERAKSWRNEVTLRTLEMLMEYEPGSYIAKISPTPLMMVVAVGDTLAAADMAIAAYNDALEPKRLVLLEGGHFDAYVADFDKAANSSARLVRDPSAALTARASCSSWDHPERGLPKSRDPRSLCQGDSRDGRRKGRVLRLAQHSLRMIEEGFAETFIGATG